MEVTVTSFSNLDRAILQLRRKVDQSGILKELRVRSFGKPSSRLRYKRRLAAKKRERDLLRRERKGL